MGYNNRTCFERKNSYRKKISVRYRRGLNSDHSAFASWFTQNREVSVSFEGLPISFLIIQPDVDEVALESHGRQIKAQKLGSSNSQILVEKFETSDAEISP